MPGKLLSHTVAGLMFVVLLGAVAQAQVDVKAVLAYKPKQSDVEYATPEAAEFAQCKLEVVRDAKTKASGYALYDPQGQLLRWFMDTDGDGKVDEYRYYMHGLEVYRDIDTNGNNEIDQSRWLNTAGMRWGIDRDEDGKLDEWKQISAEEASREAVLALVTRNAGRLQAVMITANDARTLGLDSSVASTLLEKGKDLTTNMGNALKSKTITPQTQWLRFDSSMLMPNMIPAEEGKTSRDVLVYENVMAIVDNNGQSGFVQMGEMVRVGDAWKLTQVPTPIEGDNFTVADGGTLLQPGIAAVGGGSTGLSEEMKALIDELSALDKNSPQADGKKEDFIRYNVARSALLNKLAAASSTDGEKQMWLQQRLEGIAAATQMETFPNGLEELQKIEDSFGNLGPGSELHAVATYQRLLVEYNLKLRDANAAEQAKIQEAWRESLDGFCRKFSRTQQASEAMLELAIAHEFNHDETKAKAWYESLVKGFPQSEPALRAQGALRRLEMTGKPFALAGKSLTGGTIDITQQYRGKVVAILFWTTWCQPCTQDLPQIQALYEKYRRDGFEVVGVNLDAPGAPVQQYIQEYKVTWPHIYEEGSYKSRPALEFGVISVPTTFLIDKRGVVVSSSASVDDLKKLVPVLVEK